MFKRAGRYLQPHLRRVHSQASSSAHSACQNTRTNPRITIASAVLVGSAVVYAGVKKVYNDPITSPNSGSVSKQDEVVAAGARTALADTSDPDVLHTLVWGSNKHEVLAPDNGREASIRTPVVSKWLDNVALRDLALHEKHGACVDARGDVYQWGEEFFGGSAIPRVPKRTLRGKNIVQVQLTDSKLYALSASGKIYALATNAAAQELRPGAPTPASDSWWGTGWLWGEDEIIDFAEIAPKDSFAWGESFTSISAGKNHLLAATSKGRAFAHPVNKLANHYGQLGFREFNIPDPSSAITKLSHLHVELTPKSIADPFVNASRSVRVIPDSDSTTIVLPSINDSSVHFCPNIFEIPVLRGVKVAQVAAGSRSSFARTVDGKVVGWGANDYGQIGLGSNVVLDTIIIPTEVVLWRMIPSDIRTSCIGVSAGGDLTAFTVERTKDSTTTVDLLIAGNGQHGGLGNNTYTNAQSNPVKAKNVSGLQQYSDKAHSLEPVIPEEITISSTGHILLALSSSAGSGGVGGRDLMLWGKNYDSELGNGKKSSLAVPNILVQPNGDRFMLMKRQAKEVRDLKGAVWKRGVKVEQHPATGYGNSAVYWKIAA
ncbi:regulator of chromosome condensation 1/beta-lactamase-inhibitor protein II [Crucibulum laeve]|uniref:Regulator of chromosome condensation 1/beta-lactamase-inhibitor protein II n=1 Tax=Crucibulum laeve TaxID=68775 RepID=A0A5C3MEV9_9AGAR|nr:regulator of chromosome condensation 1/beta-lactamase-inhibitor protein II [Crucibulum laeve]